MDPDQYRELAGHFASLCDLPADLRQAQLLALGARDPDLAVQLERMLAADPGTAWLDRGPSAALMFLAPPAEAPPPERVGAFRIGAEIGRGGMGIVYQAEQDRPRRLVAVKILRGRADPAAAERFRAEAQALADLEHPGIPAVYAAGEDDGRLWLAMERVDGVPLDRAAPADTAGRLRLVLAVCDAVAHAHAHGVVHRDLKPSNVLVGADGQPRVVDFGIAGRASDPSPAAGTPAWASPEQLAGAPPSPAADVYALATIAWELVAGRPPPATHPALAGDLGRALTAARHPDPKLRTPTITAFAADLAAVLDQRPLPSAPGSWPHRVRLFLRRHRRIVAVGLGLGSAVAAGLAGERWIEHRRQRTADAHLAAARVRMADLRSRGADAEADEVFETFVRLPEHRGTRAVSDAWRDQAAHQHALGRRDAELRALAEAWIQAPDPTSSAEAAVALGQTFADDGRFDALWELGREQSSAVREALAPALLRAAVARRDVGAARVLGASVPAVGLDAVLGLLGAATPLGRTSEGATLLDADGDGHPELWSVVPGARLEVHTLGLSGEPSRVVGVLPNPAEVAVHAENLVRVGDRVLLVGATEDRASTGVWEATAALDGWVQRATLPGSTPGAVVAGDLDGDGRETLWVGLAYPVRRLIEVDPADGSVHAPHPDTDRLDSAMMALAIADLDGDGRDDLVVAPGAWTAYEVRALLGRPGGLSFGGRARLGAVHALAIWPRDPGPPWIVAAKSDDTPSRTALGAASPYGEPPGLYLLDPADGLGVGHRHLAPIADPAPTNEIKPVFVADLEGGPALIAGLTKFGDRPWTWILPSPEDDPGFVVPDIAPIGTADVDGDGWDEVLVVDGDRALWWLGTGSTPLPEWRGPAARQSASGPPPPGADRVLASAWSRVRLLEDAGMSALAAAALDQIVALAPEPATAARANLAAAAIEEALGRDAAAADRYAAALPHLDDADQLRARTRLARTAARTFRLGEAAVASRGIAGLEWIAEASERDERHELLPPSGLDPRWSVRDPAALLWDPQGRGWRLDLFEASAEVARTRLTSAGVRVGFEVEVDVDLLELGAGVRLELRTPAGEPVLAARVYGQGGGGFTGLTVGCGIRQAERVWAADLADGVRPPAVTLRIERTDALGGSVCAVIPAGSPPTWSSTALDPAPIPTGPLDLVVSAGVDPAYGVVARWRGWVRGLRTVGLGWPDRPGEVPPTSLLARLLVEGRAERAIGSLRGDEPEAPEILARTADPRLGSVLARLDAEGRHAELHQILRRHESAVAPALHRAVGHARFLELFSEAWIGALRYRQRPDVVSALGRPEIDPLDGARDREAALLVARAHLAWDRGRADEALVDLARVTASDPAVRAAAALLRARVAAARGDQDAPDLLAAYLSAAPSPEVGRDIAAGFPELAQ